MIGDTFSFLILIGSGFARGAFTATGFAARGFAATGFAAGGFTATGFAITGFGAGLLGFTVTLDVGRGVALGCGRDNFLAATALGIAFLGAATARRLAALFGFFEGI